MDGASLAAGNTINASNGTVTYVATWSGTSTITATASGCNASPTTQFVETITPTVTINPFSPASATRCQGAGTVTNTTTANNSTGITYSLDAASLAAGNTINSSTGTVTYVATWSGTTYVTATASGCNASPTTVFTETVTPTVTINPFSPASNSRCQGSGLVVTTTTANNGTGITYSLDATSLAAGNTINSASGGVTYVGTWTGNSVITATASGCNASPTTQFTETTVPTVTINPFSPASATRCQGAGTVTNTTTANNSTGITYSLDGPSLAGGNTINSSNGTVTYAATWTGTTVVTATASGCNASPTTTFTETITPTVTINPFSPATGTRCQGAGTVQNTTTANNSTGIVYSLDGPSLAGGNTINSSNGIVTYVPTWSGTSIVTATASGCNASPTATFTETITPTVSVPGAPTTTTTSPICQASVPTTYTSTGTTYATSYNWTVSGSGNVFAANNSNTISSTSALTETVNWAPGFTGTATISISANGCSGPSAVASPTMSVTPTVNIAPFSPASATRCQGAGVVTNTTTASNNSSAIVYSLDGASLAGGNTINASSGAIRND